MELVQNSGRVFARVLDRYKFRGYIFNTIRPVRFCVRTLTIISRMSSTAKIRETLKSKNFWDHTWPQLRELDDFEVYYNDASASETIK